MTRGSFGWRLQSFLAEAKLPLLTCRKVKLMCVRVRLCYQGEIHWREREREREKFSRKMMQMNDGRLLRFRLLPDCTHKKVQSTCNGSAFVQHNQKLLLDTLHSALWNMHPLFSWTRLTGCQAVSSRKSCSPSSSSSSSSSSVYDSL